MEQLKITYHQETDSFLVFCDDSKTILKQLEKEGFIDADVLHEDWLAYGHRIYRLEENWRSNIRNYSYCTIEFVGFPYHVIPNDRQTPEQRWFIRSLFDD